MRIRNCRRVVIFFGSDLNGHPSCICQSESGKTKIFIMVWLRLDASGSKAPDARNLDGSKERGDRKMRRET